MITVRDIEQFLYDWAPPDTAESWDNVGLLVGRPDRCLLYTSAPIFLSIGMHCLGCPSSRGETVEEACAVHGIDVDKLLALVNEEANKSAQ